MPAGRPLKFQSIEELDSAVKTYFAEREEKKLPLTMSGLALALDVHRETLLNYSERPEFFDTLSRAKQRCEDYAECQAFVGKNPTGAAFVLTNNHDGWENKSKNDTTLKGDKDNPLQHNHAGKVDMGADLIASAVERVLSK